MRYYRQNIVLLYYITMFIKQLFPEFRGINWRTTEGWASVIDPKEYCNKPINYLEVGVLNGANLITFAKTYGLHNDSKFYCVDPWYDYDGYSEYITQQDTNYELFTWNIEKAELSNKVVECRGCSNTEVPKLQDEFFDIIYIDANHEPEYVLEDAVLSFRKLKKGGIMIFDDYGFGGPGLTQKGIDAFLSGYYKRIVVLGLHHECQLFIKKL